MRTYGQNLSYIKRVLEVDENFNLPPEKIDRFKGIEFL